MQKNNADIDYRIVERSWMARIAAWKLGARSVAFVLGRNIYLFNVSAQEFLQDESWLRHELCHVQQFRRHGFFLFIIKYLYESIRHGYYNNKYEVEARAAEKECGG
ncbi:MAG: DUF4157 domain-containing protein [Ferruginibacter sp.]